MPACSANMDRSLAGVLQVRGRQSRHRLGVPLSRRPVSPKCLRAASLNRGRDHRHAGGACYSKAKAASTAYHLSATARPRPCLREAYMLLRLLAGPRSASRHQEPHSRSPAGVPGAASAVRGTSSEESRGAADARRLMEVPGRRASRGAALHTPARLELGTASFEMVVGGSRDVSNRSGPRPVLSVGSHSMARSQLKEISSSRRV